MFTALLVGTDRAYNVADANGMVSIRDLARRFAEARPEKHLKRIFANPDHADDRAYNQSKYLGLDSSAVEALGWSAQVDLEHGIDRMLRSYEETPAG